MVLPLLAVSCSKEKKDALPGNFNSLPTEKKMETLVKTMSPDSLAVFLNEAAMGKIEGVNINLPEALDYVYLHYDEKDQVAFVEADTRFEESLPLPEKVKYSEKAHPDDREEYFINVGLMYVGVIRDRNLTAAKAKEEVDAFMKECRATNPVLYQRFIKGFKTALRYDRGRDLDERIYNQFIYYPDSLQ